jgi:glycosyltransferase involved in cell wall biosynthesis
VTPVFRTPPDFLRQMIDSVIAQSYEKWELVLVNVSGACPEVDEVLGAYEDERIRVIVAENKDISSNTNVGIAAARGDYVAFVDHDDFVEPDALFRYVEAINAHPECDLLFCDEDYWGEVDGRELFFAPKFKPGWNPDLLYTYNYVCHMLCVSRRALALTERSDAEVAAAQDYDLTFKAAAVAREIVHVPRMLYHWRDHAASTARHRESKPYALIAGQKAVQREIDRRGLPATVEYGSTDFSYRIRYELPDPSPTASVVIVPRDGSDALDHMRTMALMRLCRVRTQVRRGTRNVSFGRAVNEAIARSAGDLVVILDEDCNPPGKGWLDDLVAPFARPEVGCVGPLMCDQDDVIQSAGLVVRKDGSPLPVEQGLAPVDLGYMNVIRHSRDCTALSAGCLVMRRTDVERIGPLNESLPETLCVEDYCLRLREHGLLVVCLASRFARRRTAWAAEQRDAATWEAGLALVRSLHPQVADGDPYFSEAFDDSNGLFQLKKSGR